MLRFAGLLVLVFLATIGAYALLNSNEKDINLAKDKIERAYNSAKKELKK